MRKHEIIGGMMMRVGNMRIGRYIQHGYKPEKAEPDLTDMVTVGAYVFALNYCLGISKKFPNKTFLFKTELERESWLIENQGEIIENPKIRSVFLFPDFDEKAVIQS
jgi:hypothetical protein